MKKIPLYYYIAFNNPDGAKAVIESFGYEIYGVKDRNDLAICVKQLIEQKGEEGVVALAKVHPDRELILETADTKTLGADGFNSEQVIPAAVVTQPVIQSPAPTTTTHDYTPILIAGMFLFGLVVTAAIIVKK